MYVLLRAYAHGSPSTLHGLPRKAGSWPSGTAMTSRRTRAAKHRQTWFSVTITIQIARGERRRSAQKICLCQKKAVVQVRLSAIVMTVQRSSRLRGGSVPSFLALPAKSPIDSRSSRRIVFSPGVEIAACCRVVMHGNQARRERCDSRRRRIGDFFWHLMIFLGISLNRCRAISAAVYKPCPYITHACRRPGADNPARYRG